MFYEISVLEIIYIYYIYVCVFIYRISVKSTYISYHELQCRQKVFQLPCTDMYLSLLSELGAKCSSKGIEC